MEVEEPESKEEERCEDAEFSILNEFQIPCSVQDLLWCPTMDLLLLLSTKGDVFVYRISHGQRIAAIRRTDNSSESHRISSLCWKHDGKQIALAYANGQIQLHDVVNTEDKARGVDKNESNLAIRHEYSVCCLQWIAACNTTSSDSKSRNKTSYGSSSGGGDNAGQSLLPPIHMTLLDRTPENFRPLPVFETHTGAYLSGDGIKSNSRELENRTADRKLNFLVSGDVGRIVQVRAYGLFTVLTIDLNAVVEVKDACIESCGLSEDCQRLVVLASTNPKPKSTQPHLLTFDTRILSELQEEIQFITQHIVEINYLLSYIDSCLEATKSRWATAYQTFYKKFKQVRMASEEQNTIPLELNVEFMNLLVTGVPSAGVHNFLTDYLQPGKLSDMKRGIDMACKTVISVCQECIHPALEQTLFRLGELLGVIKWSRKYRHVDLKSETIEEVTSATEDVLITTEGLKHIAMKTQKGYNAFFEWLAICMRRLSSDSDDQKDEILAIGEEKFGDVAGCLKHDIVQDRLGGFFKDISSHFESKTTDVKQMSLIHAMKLLRSSWKKVISQPDRALSPHVSLISQVKIEKGIMRLDKYPTTAANLMAINTTHVHGFEYALFGREAKMGEPLMTLIRTRHVPLPEGGFECFVGAVALKFPDCNPENNAEFSSKNPSDTELEVVSVAFYNAEYIAMLVKTGKHGSRLWLVNFINLEYEAIPQRKTRTRSSTGGALFVIPNRGVHTCMGLIARDGDLKCAATGFTICAGRESAAITDAKHNIIALDVSEREEDEEDRGDEGEDEAEGEVS
eukprot:CAMPEP_0184484774 /NCGR_PEP_ID=MMETSP0113_2-20130426/6449_1 /TAXON_ID=91329 /ORGANISM="Norrisiella sphaerica, Strain BC52" /LENGTH=795 /DNA_ID=CAMNT_0026865905 /DNA_START=32 /DNA_END=2419 /DNA_ORIENTATION=-